MIIIFIFVILLVLIVLKYLSNVNLINNNIPLIYVCILFLIVPFLYLARRNTDRELFSNNPETVDMYYLNEKKEKVCDCPGICDKETQNYNQKFKNLEMIDNPVQSNIIETQTNPVKATIFSGSNTQGSGFKLQIKNSLGKEKSISQNDNGVYIVSIHINNLIAFSKNKIDSNLLDLKKFGPETKLINIIEHLNKIQNNSFIILGTSGGNLSNLIDGNPNEMNELKNKFKLKLIDQLENGDSFAAVLFKKTNDNYVEYQQELSRKTSNSGVFISDINLLRKGVSFEIIKKGKKIEDEEINNQINYNNTPFVKYNYVFIKPVNTNKDFSLVFTVEKTDSFVYLTDRKENEENPIYSEDQKMGNNLSIKTFINLKQPQKWSIIPVFISEFTDTYFITTFDKPNYYLTVKVDNGQPKLVVSLYRSGSENYWKILPFRGEKGTFLIQNYKTNLYLGYNNFGGYLYNDNGSVDLVESDKFNWKFKNGPEIKKNWEKNTKQFYFKDFTSPYDFPNVENPKFVIKTAKGKIDLSGKSPWIKYYTPIWKGNWIYYGTVATYGNNKPINEVKFLEININNDGIGYVNDTFFNMKIKVRNAGSNYLFGNITNGKYTGYLAVFEMAPLKLDYKGPQQGYPVRMRYLLINNKNKIYNLSSGDINNLNAYSTKYDAKTVGISNYLGMSGSTTLVDENLGIGFPKQ